MKGAVINVAHRACRMKCTAYNDESGVAMYSGLWNGEVSIVDEVIRAS